MGYAASFDCAVCGTLCEFRAANFAESGLCDECYAAQAACSYCDAPITDGGGPYCDECLGRFYGRRPCVACGVSVAGWPDACPSCGSEAWTGGAA